MSKSKSEKLSKDAKKLLKWKMREHFRSNLPLSRGSLTSLKMGQLRFLAREFTPYDGALAREWRQPDYIRFIAGVQHERSNLIPLPPIPFGELPILKKIEGIGL